MLKSHPFETRPTLRFVWSHPAHAVALAGGVPIAFALLGTPWPALAVALAASFALGIWAAGVTGRALGDEDPGCIVFDETWAAVLTFLAIPADPVWWLAGFLAFRFFDIVKPQPIRAIQDGLRGGLGVMADDLAAALASIALIDGVALLIGRM